MAEVDSDSTDCSDAGDWSELSDAEDCNEGYVSTEETCPTACPETDDGNMPIEGNEQYSVEQATGIPDPSNHPGADGVIFDEEEDVSARRIEETVSSDAEYAPARRRADGLTGSNCADESEVTMRRWYSWCSPPLPVRKEKQKPKVASSSSRRPSSLSSKSSSSSSTSSTNAPGGLHVKFLLTNDKFTPIHVKLDVFDKRGGAPACLGSFRKVVAAGVCDFAMATLPLQRVQVVCNVGGSQHVEEGPWCVQDVESISENWSFGLGDPDAVHSKSIRYSLPFNGAARHVCQSFGTAAASSLYSADTIDRCRREILAHRSAA
eukprot:749335-Hanusia_phi.AAC.1